MHGTRTVAVLWGLVAVLLVAVLVAGAFAQPALLTGALLAVLVAVLFLATAWTLRALPAARDGARPRASASAFEAIVNIAVDAIISVDDDQRIILFNEGAERIFRYDAEEIRGKPLSTLLPERFRGVHGRHLHRFAGSSTTARRMGERDEIVGLRANGEEFPAEASISKMYIDGQRYFTVVLRDITERRREAARERFLAETTALLTSSLDYHETLRRLARRAVPELADWCVVYVEEDGELRRLQTAHADPAKDALLAELQDYAMDRSRPHPVFPVVETGEPELIEEFPASLMEAVAQDDRHLELLRTVGMGSVIMVPLTARDQTLGAIALVNEPGGRRFWPEDLAFAEDVAQRAALAVDNARLYSQARTAIAARDEVMGVVSHDLGNPLSAIFVGTRLLKRRLEKQAAEDPTLRQVDDIRRAATQMERLIGDLMEIQRIEAGHLSITPAPYPTRSLLDDACRSMEPLAEEKEIQLSCHVHDDGGTVFADHARVMQVLSNLIGNAIKFTPAGGRVAVTAGENGEAVVFEVKDTGPGIGTEELPHIFDRFWQASQEGRRGVGLGLAIARALVEAQGGDIAAESEEGVGSTFRFTLPRPPAGAGRD